MILDQDTDTLEKDTKLPDYLDNEKAHPWRRCTKGKHFVKEHDTRVPPSKDHPGEMPKGIMDLRGYYQLLQG